MNDWQPIETAPKDGTTILAVDAWFTYAVVYYEELRPRSIYVWRIIDSPTIYRKDRFTHWMSLPAQPTQEPKP